MPKITADDERLMKEDVLGFLRRHPMLLPVLAVVGVVPVKPCAILQGIHDRHKSSIRPTYTSQWVGGAALEIEINRNPMQTVGATWPRC
jgi:hypothetical protein